MKKWFPIVVIALFAAWLVSKIPQRKEEGLSIREFSRLPILAGGRQQPIDSLARNSLLQLRGKQTANYEPWKSWYQKPKIASASDWLMEVLMNPVVADTRPVFRVDHPELKGLLGLPMQKGFETDAKHFSWNQLSPKSNELLKEMQGASEKKDEDRTPYHKAVINLWRATFLYQQLKTCLQPPDARDWPKELNAFIDNRAAGREAAIAQQDGRPHNEQALQSIMQDAARFDMMERYDELGKQLKMRVPLFLPPATGNSDDDWRRTGQALMDAARGLAPNPGLAHYAVIGAAYRANDALAFNQAVASYRGSLAGHIDANLKQASREQFFNHLQLFYLAMTLCIVSFMFAIFYWFQPAEWDFVRRSASWLLFLAWVVTTVGLCFRMNLIGRPPVINLYSSAVFIAWGAPLLGLILERFWRNSIGVVVGSMIGAMCLIVAHYLSLQKDTLEMLQAVLDTNFWLATHVVIVTLGYASTFVAGFLGLIFVIMGFFTRNLTPDFKRSLARMTYGIICFATLFSFVGTVLGGIWADQSWGRFWGWDPKENGAIIIVLWNALVLHARWGALVRERGLMNLAIIGNIVTSWSWFGTNMLSIGLHSYGRMDAAYYTLIGFVISMLAIFAIGLLPTRFWQSPIDMKEEAAPSKKKGEKLEPQPA